MERLDGTLMDPTGQSDARSETQDRHRLVSTYAPVATIHNDKQVSPVTAEDKYVELLLSVVFHDCTLFA